MSRTIEIGGVTLTLETGKTPAPRKLLTGRHKGPLRLLLEAMKEGESVYLPSTLYSKKRSNTLTVTAKATGRAFMARSEGQGFRIYCTEPKPAKPNGAARQMVAPVSAPQAWAA